MSHSTAPSPSVHEPTSGQCISCGGPVTSRDQFCPSCGRPRGSASAGPAREEALAAAEDVTVDRTELSSDRRFHCESCGAEVTFGPNERSTNCPFCDIAYVAELPIDQSRPHPEFIIGFAVTKERARGLFQHWLKENSWFRPGDLATHSIEEKLRGVYLPFWSFAAHVDTTWSANIGEHWYRTETYTTRDSNGNTTTHTRTVRHTEWWPLSGKRQDFWWGHFVSASRGITAEEAAQIMPYVTESLARFRPQFLAGWLSEECALEMEAAWDAACEAYRRSEQQRTAAFMPGDTHSDLRVQTNWCRISEDLVLLPVYVLSYRYQDRVFRFLVNGQTGKYVGEKPVSGKRIFAVVAVVLVVLLLFFLLIAILGR